MLLRTPYGIPPYPIADYKRVLGPSPEFDRDGYIFAYQDARGKFRSEGTFRVMNPYKPAKESPKDVDESSDNYDTIDWLLKNIPHNNGRVGQWGISYPAWQTVMGMIAAHPALKAVVTAVVAVDMFIGDDFHHNGAFRFMYTFSWLSGNARPRGAQTTERRTPFNYGTNDAYNFFLNLGTVARVNELYFHDQIPTWNDFLQHPNYDRYWQEQNALKDLKGHHARGAQRHRMVRPGRLLRSDEHLLHDREEQPGNTEHACRRTRGTTAAGHERRRLTRRR